MQAYHRLVSVLRLIRKDVATLLDKEAINAVCREEKYTWKDRLLNPPIRSICSFSRSSTRTHR